MTVSKPTHVGALVYRLRSGRPEFLLITSRRSGRWIIPKGRREQHEAPHVAVAREAFEEAGIQGVVGTKRIGSYRDRPVYGNQATVSLYPLLAARQGKSWPEKGLRKMMWAPAPTAAENLPRTLAKLVESFASELNQKRSGK